MGLATYVLLATEILFTILKSILFESDKRSVIFAAYVCYISESIAGFALTMVLASRAWNANLTNLILAGVVIIVLAEIVSVLTELFIVRRRHRDTQETTGQKRRRYLLYFAPVISIIALPMPYWFQLIDLTNTSHEENLTFRSHITVGIGTMFFIVLVCVQCLPQESFVLKTCISAVVMLVAFIATTVVLTVTTDEKIADDFSFFPLSASVSALLFPLASFLTAAAAFGVKLSDDMDVIGSEIQVVFAVAALSAIGPGVIISQAGPGREMVQVFFALVPQLGALLFPMLFVVLKCIFTGNKTPEAPRDTMQSGFDNSTAINVYSSSQKPVGAVSSGYYSWHIP